MINYIGTRTGTFISADVSTTRALDFETLSDKSFSLTIQVSDVTNVASEIVVVTTEDVNDNFQYSHNLLDMLSMSMKLKLGPL